MTINKFLMRPSLGKKNEAAIDAGLYPLGNWLEKDCVRLWLPAAILFITFLHWSVKS
jgi:hypothetical protein